MWIVKMRYLHQDYHEELDSKTLFTLNPLLGKLIEQAENVSGEWNGDESGTLEDRAHIADDIVLAATELQDLIAQLENEDY